ncbi:hypothetical protein VLK31_03515 [Variovorax sp. H27-G14]|uniref:hypothetical protein n=1 Tax=Variovorax sp. H27-G14 TaxID=3111914 RepID=UPI0038FBE90B
MMSGNLRWLIWAAVLVGIWTQLLDWRDGLVPLKSEALTAQTREVREQAALKDSNWAAEAVRANEIRLRWLDRFQLAESAGLLRVKALEAVKAICVDVKVGCQISAVGENESAAARPGAPVDNKAAANAQLAGVSVVRVKTTFRFEPKPFMELLRALGENDNLYAIERVAVTGPSAEILIKVYGIDTTVASLLRAGNGSIK